MTTDMPNTKITDWSARISPSLALATGNHAGAHACGHAGPAL